MIIVLKISGDSSTQQYTTVGTAVLQIRVKAPNRSRSSSKNVFNVVRSSSFNYARRNSERTGTNLLALATDKSTQGHCPHV